MLPSRVVDQFGTIHVLDASGWDYVPDVEPEEKYPWRGYLWIATGLIGAAAFGGIGYAVYQAVWG